MAERFERSTRRAKTFSGPGLGSVVSRVPVPDPRNHSARRRAGNQRTRHTRHAFLTRRGSRSTLPAVRIDVYA